MNRFNRRRDYVASSHRSSVVYLLNETRLGPPARLINIMSGCFNKRIYEREGKLLSLSSIISTIYKEMSRSAFAFDPTRGRIQNSKPRRLTRFFSIGETKDTKMRIHENANTLNFLPREMRIKLQKTTTCPTQARTLRGASRLSLSVDLSLTHTRITK